MHFFYLLTVRARGGTRAGQDNRWSMRVDCASLEGGGGGLGGHTYEFVEGHVTNPSCGGGGGYGCGFALKSNSEALEVKNRAVEGRGRSQWRPGGSKWSLGGSIDQLSQIPIRLMRSRIRIRIKEKKVAPDPVPH
jgi:hypothetical protein